MKIQALVVAAALSLSASAFAQDVKVDYDKDANFAALKTFTVKIGTSWNNPLSEKRVQRNDRVSTAALRYVRRTYSAEPVVVMPSRPIISRRMKKMRAGFFIDWKC